MCPLNKPQVLLYQPIHEQGLDLLGQKAEVIMAPQPSEDAVLDLDVLEEEPPPKDHPLLQLENVLITPHSAALTEEATARMGREVAEDMIRVLEGKEPQYPVNAPLNPERSSQ